MTFKKARKLMKILVYGSVLIMLIALFGFKENEIEQIYFILASILTFAAGMIVCKKWCKCPWCGETLFRKVMNLEVCPYCGRNIETGKHSKKSKKK